MACTNPIYGGIRLRPTPSIDTRCSKENIEVPIESTLEIPSGIVKLRKEEREGTARGDSSISSKENESKVANLAKMAQIRSQPLKAYPIKSKATPSPKAYPIKSSSPKAVPINKSWSKSPLINSPSSINSAKDKFSPWYIRSSSTLSTASGSGWADKYGTTLRSYDSASSTSINPRSEEILRGSRNYVASVRNGSVSAGKGGDKYGRDAASLEESAAVPSLNRLARSSPRNRTTKPPEKGEIDSPRSRVSAAGTAGSIASQDRYGINAPIGSVHASSSECAPTFSKGIARSRVGTASFGSTFGVGSVEERYGITAPSFDVDSTKSPAIKGSWSRITPSPSPVNRFETGTPRNWEIIQESRSYVTDKSWSTNSRQGASEFEPQSSTPRNREIIRQSRSHVGRLASDSPTTSTNQRKSRPTAAAPPPHAKSDLSFSGRTTNTATTVKSTESYFSLPPLRSYADDVVDASDESILETELGGRFVAALEDALVDRPLPGSASVIEGMERKLGRIRREKGETEDAMLKRIAAAEDSKKEIENRLSREKEGSDDAKNELCKELEEEQREKERAEAELQKELGEIQSLKCRVQSKTDDVTKQKEELTRHLNALAKSRSEILSSIEAESALVEKDKQALLAVAGERRSVQTAKMENKELERKVELMTEAASKQKAALQAEAADLKALEATLHKLKEANEATLREVDDEKRDLLETTLLLQKKKQELLESKVKIENEMKAEREELQRQVEESRMMHSRDMERMVKRRAFGYLKRGGGESRGTKGVNIEALIKARVDAELKKRGIEKKERELEMKEREMNKREASEREVRGKEVGELKRREREMRERNRFVREKERIVKERKGRQSELKTLHGDEIEARDDVVVVHDDSGFNIEMVAKSSVEAELKETESELKARESDLGVSSNSASAQSWELSLSRWNSSTTTQERCNKTAHDELPFPSIFLSPRKDDETTLGDESTIALNDLSKDQIKQLIRKMHRGQLEQTDTDELASKGKSSKLFAMEKELQSLREARLRNDSNRIHRRGVKSSFDLTDTSYGKHEDRELQTKHVLKSQSFTSSDFAKKESLQPVEDNALQKHAYSSCMMPRLAQSNGS